MNAKNKHQQGKCLEACSLINNSIYWGKSKIFKQYFHIYSQNHIEKSRLSLYGSLSPLISLFLPFSVPMGPLPVSTSLSLSLSQYLSLTVSRYRSLTFFLTLSFTFSLSFSVSHFLYLSLSHTISSLRQSFPIFLPLSLSVAHYQLLSSSMWLSFA